MEEKCIKESRENDKVLSEALAGKISAELKKKKNFADDVVKSVDTEIKRK